MVHRLKIQHLPSASPVHLPPLTDEVRRIKSCSLIAPVGWYHSRPRFPTGFPSSLHPSARRDRLRSVAAKGRSIGWGFSTGCAVQTSPAFNQPSSKDKCLIRRNAPVRRAMSRGWCWLRIRKYRWESWFTKVTVIAADGWRTRLNMSDWKNQCAQLCCLRIPANMAAGQKRCVLFGSVTNRSSIDWVQFCVLVSEADNRITLRPATVKVKKCSSANHKGWGPRLYKSPGNRISHPPRV